MDDGEIMNNLRCVAAPIFDESGEARYAISVSALYSNLQGEALNKAVRMVRSAAGIISSALGAPKK
jgi:DNA-binding IclR family transcriptional regulator